MNNQIIRIRQAKARDLDIVLQLLQDSGFLCEGVVELGYYRDGVPLQWLAVAAEYSGSRGGRLVRAAPAQAIDPRAFEVHLLTNTAASFYSVSVSSSWIGGRSSKQSPTQ